MANINFCFPSDPMSPREVDPEYAADAKAFAELGAGVLVWPMDEPGARVTPAKGFAQTEGAPVAWRGWMLDSDRYQAWVSALGAREPRFSLDQYETHHRMRNWVPAVEDHTPKAWFIGSSAGVAPEMFPCHVKDGVKSANAANLPRPCTSQADVALHETELKRQRGKLDDGLVLRQHVEAWEKETRVWVMGPTIDDFYFFASGRGAPEPSVDWLAEVLAKAPANFFDAPFTMDIVRQKDPCKYLVMDMGDAGVSDYKEGTQNEAFLKFLREKWVDVLSAPGRAPSVAPGAAVETGLAMG